jgi:tryptophan synthase alpha chain
VLREPVFARGVERFATSWPSGASAADRARPPLEEAPACSTPATRRDRLVPLVAPTTPDPTPGARSARAPAASSTPSPVTGTTGERTNPAPPSGEPGARGRHRRFRARCSRGAKAHTAVPVALGFGITTPEQAAARRRRGSGRGDSSARASCAPAEADADGADPAAAVREAVAALAAGLAR